MWFLNQGLRKMDRRWGMDQCEQAEMLDIPTHSVGKVS